MWEQRQIGTGLFLTGVVWLAIHRLLRGQYQAEPLSFQGANCIFLSDQANRIRLGFALVRFGSASCD